MDFFETKQGKEIIDALLRTSERRTQAMEAQNRLLEERNRLLERQNAFLAHIAGIPTGQDNAVTVVFQGKETGWRLRKEAIDFFTEKKASLDGDDRELANHVLQDLLAGKSKCRDGKTTTWIEQLREDIA